MKRWAIIAAVLVVYTAGVYAVGRYTAREPDVREVERVVFKDRVVEVTVKEEAKVKVVYRTRVVKPDGTKVETETETTKTETTEKTDTTKTTDATKDTTRVVTTPRPDWRVSLMGGAQLEIAPLSAAPLVGASVERRIAGPFSAGAWVLVRPTPSLGMAGGLSLSVEF